MSARREPSWRWATALAGSSSAALLALALWAMQEPGLHLKRIPLPEAITRCDRDADCVLESRVACCSCRSGGPRGAIRRGEEETLRRFLKKTCRRNRVCVRLDGCQWDLAPACRGGRCIAEVPRG